MEDSKERQRERVSVEEVSRLFHELAVEFRKLLEKARKEREGTNRGSTS